MLRHQLGKAVVADARHLGRLVRAPQAVDRRHAEREDLGIVGKRIDDAQPLVELVERRNPAHPLAEVLLPARGLHQLVEETARERND